MLKDTGKGRVGEEDMYAPQVRGVERTCIGMHHKGEEWRGHELVMHHKGGGVERTCIGMHHKGGGVDRTCIGVHHKVRGVDRTCIGMHHRGGEWTGHVLVCTTGEGSGVERT